MPDEIEKTAIPDGIDWSVTTFEGNRRRQHEEFHARPFREKLAALEEMEVVSNHFSPRRAVDEPPRLALNSEAERAATESDHG